MLDNFGTLLLLRLHKHVHTRNAAICEHSAICRQNVRWQNLIQISTVYSTLLLRYRQSTPDFVCEASGTHWILGGDLIMWRPYWLKTKTHSSQNRSIFVHAAIHNVKKSYPPSSFQLNADDTKENTHGTYGIAQTNSLFTKPFLIVWQFCIKRCQFLHEITPRYGFSSIRKIFSLSKADILMHILVLNSSIQSKNLFLCKFVLFAVVLIHSHVISFP